jgi:parallel beta-helix repeat protein
MYAITCQPVTAQSTIGAIINSDGSVIGTSLIERNGDIYVFTGNISGGLQIQKSNITLNGAGFAIIGNNAGRGIDFSVNSENPSVSLSVENVTITNLIIKDFVTGVYAVNSGSNTFYGNIVSNCEVGFWISGSSNNGILTILLQDNIAGI